MPTKSMPIYLYQTDDDQLPSQFEMLQGVTDAPLLQCPTTGRPVRRIMAAFSYHQRGLKRSAKIDKRSPAATACGCASSKALAIAQGSQVQGKRSFAKMGKAGHSGHGHNCKRHTLSSR